MLGHSVGMALTWCCRQAPKRSLAARLEMALDVARGMAALEENDPPIVHRDLKPTNIFIDAGQLNQACACGQSLAWVLLCRPLYGYEVSLCASGCTGHPRNGITSFYNCIQQDADSV